MLVDKKTEVFVEGGYRLDSFNELIESIEQEKEVD